MRELRHRTAAAPLTWLVHRGRRLAGPCLAGIWHLSVFASGEERNASAHATTAPAAIHDDIRDIAGGPRVGSTAKDGPQTRNDWINA